MTNELAKTNDKQQIVSDLRNKIIAATIKSKDSAHTQRVYKAALSKFADWYAQQSAAQIDSVLLLDYRQHLIDNGAAVSTVNQAMSAIRAMCAQAEKFGIITRADLFYITREVKNIKQTKLPRGRAASVGEVGAMVQAAVDSGSAKGQRDSAIIALMYSAGLRRAEIVDLSLADYEPETGQILVTGKGRKERIVFVDNGAKAALADWLELRGSQDGALFCRILKSGRLLPDKITSQAIYDSLKKWADQAQVDDISPHDLRRGFISDLLDQDVDLSTVSQLAGHSRPETTMRYDRRSDQAKRAAAARLHVPYKRRQKRLT